MNPVSSSSTCRAPASRHSLGNGSKGRRRIDPAAARPARRGQARPRAARDLARLHPHGRPDTQRHLGRQADVEPDAVVAPARDRLPDRSGDGCCRRSATSSAATPCSSTSIVLTLCHRRFRSGVPCRHGCGAAGPTRGGTPAPSTTPGPSRMSSPCCEPGEGLARLVRRGGYRANRDLLSGAVAQPHPDRRQRARSARAGSAVGARPVLERQADQRSDEWVDRYRAEAEKRPPT